MQSIFKILLQDLLRRISTKSPQDLAWESWPKSLHWDDLVEILVKSPGRSVHIILCRTLWEHLVGILVKCCQRPLHDLVQVLARRSSRGPGSWENLTGSPPKGLLLLEEILQDSDTRTSQEHPRKAFIQAPNCIHGSCKIFMQGPLREWSSSHSATTRAIKVTRGLRLRYQIRIAPQRERSDTHKATKGLCDHKSSQAVEMHMDISQGNFCTRFFITCHKMSMWKIRGLDGVP